MIAITTWMEHFLTALHKTFGDRISFIGLQGSYARGEASDTSDIDVVVILDSVSAADLKDYRAMLDPLPHRDRICGFFSGKQELLNWEPSDHTERSGPCGQNRRLQYLPCLRTQHAA